ncbi:MAG: tetratricopeptide repeat protein [Methanobrevibacter sp.]|jgi:tetratricopeptide (TPR) repeat protein|nr:tetratricopeptide repeat protein [Candidatus Methanovirga meridionalis]
MPILSFGSQNIDLITGKKTSTIRKLWKTPLKKGDRLHCYWNLVSKEKKKIFEAKVVEVDIIEYKDLKNNNEIAIKEGYNSSKEMIKEFKKMYVDKLKDDDKFQIIKFKKLDINEWKGEKIDEKAMVTQRADILFDSGKYDKSELCYSAALEFDPNDIYLLNKKGDNLSRIGRFQEAIECYDRALTIEKNNEHIWNNKAIALLNYDKVEEALENSNKAMSLNPKNPSILYWRGFILQVLGKLDDALKIYDTLIKIDLENPEVWNARGNLLTEMDRHKEALESYDKGLEYCFDEKDIDPITQNRKGNALFDLGRYEEALKSYDEAIRLDKDNEWFWLNKGVVLLELRRFKEANMIFTKVLSMNPKSDDARVLKDECLENM